MGKLSLAAGSESERQWNGWTDRALQWAWQEAWVWTKEAMILLPGTRKRDFQAEWIRTWGSVSCQEWGRKGVASSTRESGQCLTLIEPPTWEKAQFSPRECEKETRTGWILNISWTPALMESWFRPQCNDFYLYCQPVEISHYGPSRGICIRDGFCACSPEVDVGQWHP